MSRTTSEWEKRVARWRASGETAEVFSAREGFAGSTLRWWASTLRRASTPPKRIGMVQLVRTPSSTPPPGRGLVIDLVDSRARIMVEAGVELATLRTVLEAFGIRGAA